MESPLEVGKPYPITASGIVAGLGTADLIGVLCSSSAGGTLTLTDGAGNVICNAMALSAGQFVRLPFTITGGLVAVVGGSLNATLGAKPR